MKSQQKFSLRFQPNDSSTPRPVGVGWYTAEEWAKMKASVTDAERFEASFSEWQAVAEKFLVDIRKQGIFPTKCFIIASELLAWCLATGKVNNGAARAEFVAQQGSQAKELKSPPVLKS
jgi:hypothetical protein